MEISGVQIHKATSVYALIPLCIGKHIYFWSWTTKSGTLLLVVLWKEGTVCGSLSLSALCAAHEGGEKDVSFIPF